MKFSKILGLALCVALSACVPSMTEKFSCVADTDCLDGYACIASVCATKGTVVTDPCVGGGGGAADATCTATAGAAVCACKDGFTGDGKTCTAVADCTKNNGGCAPSARCSGAPGAIS